jgi:hypothetical protein
MAAPTYLVAGMARSGPAVSTMRVFDSVQECKDYAAGDPVGQNKHGSFRIWRVSDDADAVLVALQKHKPVNGRVTRVWVDK